MNIDDILKRAQAAYVASETEVVTELPTDDQVPVIGERCRRCSKGRYLHHQTGKVGVCYRCHGKGFFDARDVAFYNMRLQGNKPLCNITGVIAS